MNDNEIQLTLNMISCNCGRLHKVPDYYQGYVMLKPIKVVYCANCEDCLLTANRFWSWIFVHILHRFWKGKIVIDVDGKKQEVQAKYEEE